MRRVKGFSKEKIKRLMDTDSNTVIVRGMGVRGEGGRRKRGINGHERRLHLGQ